MYATKILIVATVLGAFLFMSQATTQGDLVHRYLFEVDGRDYVGGAHATLVNGASVSDGSVHLDQSLEQYVDLPIGTTMGNLGAELTVEAWALDIGTGGPYARIFDLGTGTSEYVAMTVRDDITLNRFFMRDTSGTNDQFGFSGATTSTLNHLVLTISGNSAKFYVNGVVSASESTTFSPSNLGITTRNWLGRSPYPNDAYLDGSIEEFSIYTHALSAQQVNDNYQNGPTGVPEPSGLGIIGVAAVLIVCKRRRRK